MVFEDVFELKPMRFVHAVSAQANLAAATGLPSAIASQYARQGAPEDLRE